MLSRSLPEQNNGHRRMGLFSRLRKGLGKRIHSPWTWRHKATPKHNGQEHHHTLANKHTPDWRTLSPQTPPLPRLARPQPETIHAAAIPFQVAYEGKHATLSYATPTPSNVPNTPIYHHRQLYTIPEEIENMSELSDKIIPSIRRMASASRSTPLPPNPTFINRTPGFHGNVTIVSDPANSISLNATPPRPILIPTPPPPPTTTTLPPTSMPSSIPSPVSTLSPVTTHNTPGMVLTGNEALCRMEFAKMVTSVYKRHVQYTGRLSARMEIELDDDNNMSLVHIFSADGSRVDTRRFIGNAQYMPPEVPMNGIFNDSLGDVWVLGISLYRMLVGRFPFQATNDAMLFRKMQQGDFSIPAQLSENAKDLLRRMLSPLPVRASLDLVMFHPWLKPCLQPYPSVLPTKPQDPDPVMTMSAGQRRRTKKDAFSHNPNRRKVFRKRMRRAITFLIEGPYPPPKRPYAELAPLG